MCEFKDGHNFDATSGYTNEFRHLNALVALKDFENKHTVWLFEALDGF